MTNQPDVSVVIAVHNGMPELTRSVTSALHQSLSPERVQVIVVDDGSSDGTAEELARLRTESDGRVEVVTQPASGGPSRPRNVGLQRAVGRYVFFLDADDYLGDEALERLVATADRNGADVVLGKIVKVEDGTSPSVFREDLDDAGLFSSRIIWTLNAQKLFRREQLEAAPEIRFPEDLWTGEDTLFTMRAYLRARRISVLGSYTCYHKVTRPGGGHVTSRPGLEPRYRATRALIELVAESVEAGPQRDVLMVPRVHSILKWFGPLFLEFDDAQRQEAVALFAPLAQQWVTSGITARLKVIDRLTLQLVVLRRPDLLEELLTSTKDGRQPTILVEGDRRYQAYPFFRNGRVDVPDSIFQIAGPPQFRPTVVALTRRGPSSLRVEGVATVAGAPNGPLAQLVAVDRTLATEHRHPVAVVAHRDTRTGVAHSRQVDFVVDVDLAHLARKAVGECRWDFFLEVEADDVRLREPLGPEAHKPPLVPSPWYLRRRNDRGSAGQQIALVFSESGPLTLQTRTVPLSLAYAHRLLSSAPIPGSLRTMLLRRIDDRSAAAAGSRSSLWRRLVRRGLARLHIRILTPRRGTYLVTRRRDLAVRRAPGGGFLVTPRRRKAELQRLGPSSFLAWRDAKVEDLGPGRKLVTTGSVRGHRVVPLPAGAALVTSQAAERERWLEQEREILGYVATQHILGVLRTYDINCVLDVGANRGQFGQMLRKGGYRGHIASFEPVPDALKDLRRRAEPDANWSVHAIALGRDEGVMTMQTIPGQATLSSMLPPSDYGRSRFPRMAEVVLQEVPVRRLDTLLDAITASIPNPRVYLKLDTQGFDLEVFRGLGERVRDIAALQSELALLKIYEGMPRMPQALEEYERAGFEVSGLFPVSREYSTTRILEYDCIFVQAAALPPKEASGSVRT